MARRRPDPASASLPKPEVHSRKKSAPKPRGPRTPSSAHALEARTPPSDSPNSDQAGPPRSAFLPRFVFLLLFLLVGGMTALEVRNVLRHPSVLFRAGPKGAPGLVFYQKGHASAREAFLLDEPDGPDGPPRLIQHIDCRPQFSDIGEIRWTADGKAVYAAGRTPQSRGVPVIRWLYVFSSEENSAAGGLGKQKAAAASESAATRPKQGRLYISQPDYALPGRTAFVEKPDALTARWHLHQGAGPLAAAWYDLGAKGGHLFSWQTTRWEKALAQ